MESSFPSSFFHPARKPDGFTLLEMLVGVAVLAMIVITVAQMVSGVTRVTGSLNARMEADAQVRTVMDRMATAFARMPRSSSLSTYFTSSNALFYSEVRPSASTNTLTTNALSLVSFRVNTDNSDVDEQYRLEYAALPMDWTNSVSLQYSSSTNGPTITGGLTAQNNPSDEQYHVLGHDIFLMRICYLLKDGTVSSAPLLGGTNTAYTANPTNGTRYYVKSNGSTPGSGFISRGPAWEPIGWQDVNAIVVSVAALDDGNREIVRNSGQSMSALANALAQASDGVTNLPAQKWQEAVTNGTVRNISPRAAAAVRVYQRYFYLQSPPNQP